MEHESDPSLARLLELGVIEQVSTPDGIAYRLHPDVATSKRQTVVTPMRRRRGKGRAFNKGGIGSP